MEENISDFSIYKKGNVIMIKNNKNKNVSNHILSINVLAYSSIIKPTNDLGDKLKDCLGIIGMITLEEDTYLITITDSKIVCTIDKKKIYKVLDTCFINFSDDLDLTINLQYEDKKVNNDNIKINEHLQNNDKELIKELKELFKSGFYYSNNYDLANSITSHNQIIFYFQKDKLITDYDYIIEGNKNFLSNWKFTDKIMSIETKNNIRYFFSNCIFGNIERFRIDNQNIDIILISRRYLWNFGNYNYRKGLSKYGGNSNQIETELILVYNNKEVFSNIHLSSYFPIYFKEKKNNQSTNDANKAFIKYFKTLIDEYNILFLFALEREIDEKYIHKLKNILKKNKNSLEDKWKYYCIKTKDMTIENVLQKIKFKKDLIEFAGYSIMEGIKIDKKISQIGIFSLLCMDDEILNKNEFFLTYDIIYHFLLELNKRYKIPIFLNEKIKPDIYDEIENNNQIIDDSMVFIDKLKTMFKNRMNELTKQYYMNYDDEKCKKYQRLYELLFGKNMKSSPLKKNLNYLKEEFSDLEKLKVFVGSWNTACTDPNNKNLILDSWLLPKDPELVPDIYFIGFQEVVELNATNVIMITDEKIQQILEQWDTKINLSIQKIGKYKKLVGMNLIGINFFCYVLENHFDKIANLSQKIVKTGLGGATGNKGSCCINFDFENTSFSIACSHLAAGANKNKQRLKELNYILDLKLDGFFNKEEFERKLKEAFDLYNEDLWEEKNESLPSNSNNINSGEINNDSLYFKNSDIWILFGDLNFRVDMDYEEFSEYVKKGNWNKLLDYDQFIKFKLASLDSMKCIQEDEIKFPPTYKYILNSNEYDYKPKDKKKKENSNEPQTSGKKRNPSWCDRVFYKKNAYVTKSGKSIISGIEYNHVIDDNFITSDHRPIYQIFDIIIFKENTKKREAIESEIISNEKLGISNKYIKKKVFDY